MSTAVVYPNERQGSAEGLFQILGKSAAPQAPRTLVPAIPLEDGEQYRFHFDASRCIGCKCCEVACSEQNNTPPQLSWRRVGEIEGGTYPDTQRLYISMGCNHCLEPSCLKGCPVDAYTKDSATGIVLHNSEACIGCEYCVWNCPYGVPIFNEERGVVGKCDMCHGRLQEGRDPACVQACPEEAIRIEIVNKEEWARQYESDANMPGLPSADHTVSTTRITMPSASPADLKKADYHRVRPEKPHYPLVAMTILTQLSIGAVAAVWLLSTLGTLPQIKVAVTAALTVGLLSFGASPLHLGRPAYAHRAMRMWRRSWLSREIVLLTGFGGAAALYAGALWMGVGPAPVLGGLATVVGLAGITATSYIYLVPARPAWNSVHTVAEFFLTAAMLGPLFLMALGIDSTALPVVTAVAASGQLVNLLLRFIRFSSSDEFELVAAARLLGNEFRRHYVARAVLLVAGGVALPLAGYPLAAFVLALAGELTGRYLFFVSVVPKNMARTYFGGITRSEAA